MKRCYAHPFIGIRIFARLHSTNANDIGGFLTFVSPNPTKYHHSVQTPSWVRFETWSKAVDAPYRLVSHLNFIIVKYVCFKKSSFSREGN